LSVGIMDQYIYILFIYGKRNPSSINARTVWNVLPLMLN
jgi:hypothetical protein